MSELQEMNNEMLLSEFELGHAPRTEIEAEILRRMTPEPTGDVGELLDKIEYFLKQNPINIGYTKWKPLRWDTREEVLPHLRQHIQQLQADSRRLDVLDKLPLFYELEFHEDYFIIKFSRNGVAGIHYPIFREAIDAAMGADNA